MPHPISLLGAAHTLISLVPVTVGSTAQCVPARFI